MSSIFNKNDMKIYSMLQEEVPDRGIRGDFGLEHQLFARPSKLLSQKAHRFHENTQNSLKVINNHTQGHKIEF